MVRRSSTVGNARQAGASAFALLVVHLATLLGSCGAGEHNYIPDPTEIECPGNVTYQRVTLTAYHPLFESDRKRDYLDAHNKKLYTLQEYLDNRAPYVTIGMDPALRLPYGKEGCIPELNRHFRRAIRLQVRDTHEDLAGGGYRRVDVCVRTQEDSYDDIVNMLQVTLVL